jgi:hypothetical protein
MRILGINAASALLASGGFERFPRAFREDADLALPAVRLGYAIVWGERVTTHPLASSADWHSRLRAQAGNADNAVLRAKYGRRQSGRARANQCPSGIVAGSRSR